MVSCYVLGFDYLVWRFDLRVLGGFGFAFSGELSCLVFLVLCLLVGLMFVWVCVYLLVFVE